MDYLDAGRFSRTGSQQSMLTKHNFDKQSTSQLDPLSVKRPSQLKDRWMVATLRPSLTNLLTRQVTKSVVGDNYRKIMSQYLPGSVQQNSSESSDDDESHSFSSDSSKREKQKRAQQTKSIKSSNRQQIGIQLQVSSLNKEIPQLRKNPSRMISILKKDQIQEEDSLENESDIDLSEEERKNDERQKQESLQLRKMRSVYQRGKSQMVKFKKAEDIININEEYVDDNNIGEQKEGENNQGNLANRKSSIFQRAKSTIGNTQRNPYLLRSTKTRVNFAYRQRTIISNFEKKETSVGGAKLTNEIEKLRLQIMEEKKRFKEERKIFKKLTFQRALYDFKKKGKCSKFCNQKL